MVVTESSKPSAMKFSRGIRGFSFISHIESFSTHIIVPIIGKSKCSSNVESVELSLEIKTNTRTMREASLNKTMIVTKDSTI